jgi:hypothetical protein
MAEFQYKVTKYDPSLHGGPGGGYTADEWTSFSDIGKSFGGVVLAEEEYLRVEELYLGAVRLAAEVSGVSRLQVRDLEGEGELTDLHWVELPEALEIVISTTDSWLFHGAAVVDDVDGSEASIAVASSGESA